MRGVSESEIIKVKAHYNWSMYQSLLNATRRSLNTIKGRLSTRTAGGVTQVITQKDEKDEKEGDKAKVSNMAAPFFEVELQLDGIGVRLRPGIDEIQSAVNGGAVAVLKCSKMIDAWDTVTIPKNVQLIINPNLPPVMGTGAQGSGGEKYAKYTFTGEIYGAS